MLIELTVETAEPVVLKVTEVVYRWPEALAAFEKCAFEKWVALFPGGHFLRGAQWRGSTEMGGSLKSGSAHRIQVT